MPGFALEAQGFQTLLGPITAVTASASYFEHSKRQRPRTAASEKLRSVSASNGSHTATALEEEIFAKSTDALRSAGGGLGARRSSTTPSSLRIIAALAVRPRALSDTGTLTRFMLVLPKGTVVPRDLPKGRACFFLRMLAAHTRWLFPLEEDRLRPHLVLPNNFSCPGELRSEQAKLTVVEGPQRSPRSHHRRPGPPMNRAISCPCWKAGC